MTTNTAGSFSSEQPHSKPVFSFSCMDKSSVCSANSSRVEAAVMMELMFKCLSSPHVRGLLVIGKSQTEPSHEEHTETPLGYRPVLPSQGMGHFIKCVF